MLIKVDDAILGKPKTALVKDPDDKHADPEVHIVLTLSIPVGSLTNGQIAALVRNTGQEVELGLERLEPVQSSLDLEPVGR